MREPGADIEHFGLLAEFDSADRLLQAARRLRDAGYRRLDAHTPYPLEELSEVLDLKSNAVAWFTFAGGVVGAAFGYGMQLYTNWDFPLDIGGRPLVAWQPFMLITFETCVLFAVTTSVLAMLLLNRLPRLHHPVFSAPHFERASLDRFFLIVFAHDEQFDTDGTDRFLRSLSPLSVTLVEQTEEPE